MGGEERIYHLGVVTNKKPLLITTRNGADCPLIIDYNFKKVDGIYGRKGSKIKYFIPTKWEEFISPTKTL